jgi:serine/threonine-protein kinase PknK
MNAEERQRLWLNRVCKLCHDLATEQELTRLFPRILDAAIEITGAQRGFLVLLEGQKADSGFRFRVQEARGFDQSALRGSEGAVSRTVVRRVLDSRAGLVSSRERDADIVDVTSVRSNHVLSIISAPLCLRGEMRGVLYLDHSAESAAFSEQDLPILETFANQAALALESAELHKSSVQTIAKTDRFGKIIGVSAVMQTLYRQVERVARCWEHTLIIGESGTGKELVAREIHNRSSYHDQPFFSENCAAIAETLLESELFGHKKGAFTGAHQNRPGLFIQAGRGTLFLDEVGDMSLAMQAKLLRVLQERKLRPVGSDQLVPIHCRVIAATHRDLRTLVQEHRFREDLFYRLDVLRLSLPPLRERPEDIPILINHFMKRFNFSFSLTDKCLGLLQSWHWPGNIRELENEILRLSLHDCGQKTAQMLSEDIRQGKGVSGAAGSLSGRTLGDVEREMVEAALAACQGNKARAARQLGIPRTSLYRMIERYGL